ncbi:MAG: acetyl-CoA hydrolase/transferase C-terminal domain-containing protein, partial [Bdellovibrio sp.]
MKTLRSNAEVIKFLEDLLPEQWRIAIPLGLGKPNRLINDIYEYAKKQKNIDLTFFTALSLDTPDPQSDLESRFVIPFYQKHFGQNYPRLEYLKDLSKNEVPLNVHLHEFYFQAGAFLHNPYAQQNYISLNYTHVAQNIFNRGINAIVQLIAQAPDGKSFSLSCNPDITLDLAALYQKHNKPLLMIGVVHKDLPFMGGDAVVSPDFFDAVVETPEDHQLFALPRGPVSACEYLIGLYASRLLKDDGTLQIGIGSLSDALTYAAILRHQDNGAYRKILASLDEIFRGQSFLDNEDDVFEKGLYGTSEMLMDGFMHLRKAGVLKRHIFDRDEKVRRYLHGAFFLGSKSFYHWLRDLNGEDFEGLSMTKVSKVNDLYDEHELAIRRQRKNARFFNSCMQMSLLGEASSDTRADGGVVSGVGGQYNFVAMSHELPDARSILMLKSTRMVKGKRVSNIVWSPPHLTIPRHLRDIVVTEYGIADLRGQSDEICIQRVLMITDAEFQEELLQTAKSNKKVSKDWQLPDSAKNNTAVNVN